MQANPNRTLGRDPQQIGIYVGQGASHSWTWFVDLLEKFGYSGLQFLGEDDFPQKAPEQDVLLVSGGDTFAVARALNPAGAGALHAFLEKGGLYIGSCAGAYLPLHSSKEYLRDFNFVKSRINNLTRDLPPVRRLPLKFSNQYGCAFIYHPVREDVRVRMAEDFPVWGGREIRVPLYGGPPLHPSEDAQACAHYTGFTERTLFLSDPEIAEQVYLGKVAACEKRFGDGRMVLLGPHFEHPGFPEGNAIIHQWIQDRRSPEANPGKVREEKNWRPETGGFSDRVLHGLKKEISNMRIRAGALARESIHWQIGAKVYEPEKIAHFVDTIWKRLGRMPDPCGNPCGNGSGEAVLDKAMDCHDRVKHLAEMIRSKEESQPHAEEMFSSLKELVMHFLEIYFRTETTRAQMKDATVLYPKRRP